MVKQNISFASTLSAIGAGLQVTAILVLAYPEFQKTKNNVKYTEKFEKLFMPMNILCQFAGGLFNTASTWYGPVSILVPINVSAQLLFNMFFFGALGIEHFPTDVRIGTSVVALGALLLPNVGPSAQDGQDVMELFDHLPAKLWMSILVGSTAISGYYCIGWIEEKSRSGFLNHEYKDLIIMIAKVSSGVLASSLSKFLAGTAGLSFVTTVIGFVACSLVVGAVSILQATETDQSSFVPISSCGIQFINAITGLIIWQDYLVVQSWPGYFTVMMQILLGVYLISSMDTFSSSVDSNYALAQSVKIQIGKEFAHKRGKSIVAFAGGSVETMLAPIMKEVLEEDIYDDDLPPDNLPSRKKSVHFRISMNTIFSISDESYGSINSEQEFTEEFPV